MLYPPANAHLSYYVQWSYMSPVVCGKDSNCVFYDKDKPENLLMMIVLIYSFSCNGPMVVVGSIVKVWGGEGENSYGSFNLLRW